MTKTIFRFVSLPVLRGANSDFEKKSSCPLSIVGIHTLIVSTKLCKPHPPWLPVAMSHIITIMSTSTLKFSRDVHLWMRNINQLILLIRWYIKDTPIFFLLGGGELCRAHEILSRADDITSRAHDTISRVHDMISI